MKKPYKILFVIGLAVVCGFLFRQQGARTSQRRLAELLPQIVAITLYDIRDRKADSNKTQRAKERKDAKKSGNGRSRGDAE